MKSGKRGKMKRTKGDSPHRTSWSRQEPKKKHKWGLFTPLVRAVKKTDAKSQADSPDQREPKKEKGAPRVSLPHWTRSSRNPKRLNRKKRKKTKKGFFYPTGQKSLFSDQLEPRKRKKKGKKEKKSWKHEVTRRWTLRKHRKPKPRSGRSPWQSLQGAKPQENRPYTHGLLVQAFLYCVLQW